MPSGIMWRRKGDGERSATLMALLLASCLGFTACTDMEHFEPPKPGEIREGPGLFSGEDGEFIIHRR